MRDEALTVYWKGSKNICGIPYTWKM